MDPGGVMIPYLSDETSGNVPDGEGEFGFTMQYPPDPRGWIEGIGIISRNREIRLASRTVLYSCRCFLRALENSQADGLDIVL